MDFLQDRTGNRRFWPVDVGVHTPTRNVWRDLDHEVDQLWAEAVVRWRSGESLYLSGELEELAQQRQEAHREASTKEGLIMDFLELPVPKHWSNWTLEQRQVFLSGNFKGDVELVPRERVCALEIWCELLGGKKGDMRRADTQEINGILDSLPGWTRTRSNMRFGYCGAQRGFVRV